MRIVILILALLPMALIIFATHGTGRGIMLISYGVILLATYALAQVIARLLWVGAQKKKIEQAKDEFLSFASHQLRTPLTTMNWRLEMLLSGDAGKLTKNQAQYVFEIEDETRRMTELVNTFLNVSRINLGTLSVQSKPCDVAAITKSVLSEFAPALAAQNIRAMNRSPRGDATIRCDASLVRMVVQNLVSNAIKYTRSGGRVEVGAKRRGTELLVTVSDTGIGIPDHAQPFIFSKLFRADNARRIQPDGTGIGLYIVKSLLDSAGGRVWFETSEGQGSTFFIALPTENTRSQNGAAALSFSKTR